MDNDNYILDILKLIDELQKKAICNESNGCNKPTLGTNNNQLYNTRPISLFLCNNKPLSISYTNGESTIFRVEKINDDCVTVRLLAHDEDGNLSSTGEFATINISCIAAIMCSSDTSLTL